MFPTDTFLTIDGLRFHLRDWGGPDAPPAIVLVHGLASNARIWDLLAPLLAPNFRLAAIDQRGHGVSDTPDGGYDLATIAGDLAGALGALGWSRPLVVGHSWGAHVVKKGYRRLFDDGTAQTWHYSLFQLGVGWKERLASYTSDPDAPPYISVSGYRGDTLRDGLTPQTPRL